MTPAEEIKQFLKRLGCIVLVVLIVFACLVRRFYWIMVGVGELIEGDFARNQAESIRNWQLPSDTEMIDFQVEEFHPLITHPEKCYLTAILILESTSSSEQIMEHYRQFNVWRFDLRREIEEIENTSSNRQRFRMSFGIEGREYHCYPPYAN